MKKIALFILVVSSFALQNTQNKGYCLLKVVYERCYQNAVKYDILKKEDSCEEVGVKYLTIMSQTLQKEYNLSTKEANTIAKSLSVACYAGCMDKKEAYKIFENYCKEK